MGGEFDLKFCNGGDFCMRVREEERVCAAGFFGGGKGERERERERPALCTELRTSS